MPALFSTNLNDNYLQLYEKKKHKVTQGVLK